MENGDVGSGLQGSCRFQYDSCILEHLLVSLPAPHKPLAPPLPSSRAPTAVASRSSLWKLACRYRKAIEVVPQALFAVAAVTATAHKSRTAQVLVNQVLVSLDKTPFDMTNSSGVARGVLAILKTMAALEMDTPCSRSLLPN